MTDSLPAGWAITSLGDICVKKVAQGPPTPDHVSYIDISSIDRTTKQIGETKFVTIRDAPTRARQWVRAKDVLVSMTRPNLNAVAQVHDDLDGAVASTGFDVLRPVSIVPEWVFYRVRTNEFIEDVCKDLQGVVYPAIRPHDVRRHQLPLPPVGEQHRIVDSLESYFTRLDDAVVTLERVQRNLKRYRASVLKAAVEGRLVPTEAELAQAEGRRYEPASVLLARILAERRRRWEEAELAKMAAKGKVPKDDKWKAKYQEPAVPDTDDLPELPHGWCWASVEQLAAHEDNSLTDGPFGSNLKSSHYTSSGPRVIRLQNIGDGEFLESEAHVSPEHFAGLRKHAVQPGDVVIASLGNDLPRACVVPEWLGPAIVKADCLRFSTHRALLRPGFALHALNASPSRKRAEDLVHGVGRPRIGLTLLRQFPVPLPPLDEQDRILEEVERLLSLGDTTKRAAHQNAARLARLRQSILKWAFEGRLVDQDPTDEPASALLERIRAERASATTKRPARSGRRKARTTTP